MSSMQNVISGAEALPALKFDRDGLIPAIVQDISSKEVLMMAYMNKDSLQKTLETNRTWFWSRSRQCYWQKGESSGNIQEVKDVYYDCDADTLLIKVKQTGPACHTGRYSCFFNPIREISEVSGYALGSGILPDLAEIIRQRAKKLPAGSYTAMLLADDKRDVTSKFAEEAIVLMFMETEIVGDGIKSDRVGDEIKQKGADLLFHLLVLLEASGVSISDVLEELNKRRCGDGTND